MTTSRDKQGITHQPKRPKINQNGPTRTKGLFLEILMLMLEFPGHLLNGPEVEIF